MDQAPKRFLFVINEGPYGDERSYNALRLALNIAKKEEAKVRVFLVGDGVQCGIKGQETHEGYYNIERMMRSVITRGEVAT